MGISCDIGLHALSLHKIGKLEMQPVAPLSISALSPSEHQSVFFPLISRLVTLITNAGDPTDHR